MIIERFNFNEKQRADFEILIKKHRVAIVQKDTELAVARQANYRQLLADGLSKKDSLAAEVGRLQTAVEQIHFAHFQEIKNLCRAEQKADFDALVGDLTNYFPGPKGRQKIDNQ
jgi:periplasmic protein CpxP/Spy